MSHRPHPPHMGPHYYKSTLQVQTAAPHNQQMPCRATNPHYLWNHPPISDPIPTNQWGQPPQYKWRHYTLSLQMELAALTISGGPMNYMYMYQGKPHLPLPNTTSGTIIAHTANGLTCTCKQNPIGPAPLPTPTIDCSLQVQGANGAIPTQQNHQSPSLQPHELTIIPPHCM